MAGNGISSIRDNLVYVGWGKEANWLTDVVPTNYWRPERGTNWDPRNTIEDDRESDTSVFETLSVKAAQFSACRIMERLRPITVGCGLQAFCGTGSDAFTIATSVTTLAAQATAGAATVQITADLGNTGTKALSLEGGYASTNYEVITIDCTTRTTPNFTYTLASAATLKLTHANGSAVRTADTHVFTIKGTTYDPYALEWGVGTGSYGTPARVVRLRDAVAYTWEIDSGPGGRAVMIGHDWYAGGHKLLTAFQTPAWEQGNFPGSVAGSPMTHNMANTAWQLNNLNTGNAAVIKNFRLRLSRNTAPDDFITEDVTPKYFLPGGEVTIDGSFECVLTSFQEFDLGLFGKTSAVNNDVDSYLVGYEPFQVTYTADAVNTFKIVMPNLRFAAPNPREFQGGRAMTLPVQFKAIKRPQDTDPLTITLTNSQGSAY